MDPGISLFLLSACDVTTHDPKFHKCVPRGNAKVVTDLALVFDEFQDM